MALRQKISTPYGVSVSNAYQRVEGVWFNAKDQISFNLRSYADESCPFIHEIAFTCSFDIEGENPFRQAYEYLKTLPEFADAVDC